jgi:hypothetical protein
MKRKVMYYVLSAVAMCKNRVDIIVIWCVDIAKSSGYQNPPMCPMSPIQNWQKR